MGTALAHLIGSNGHRVKLWNYDPKVLQGIERSGKGQALPGIKLSKNIRCVPEISDAVSDSKVVIIAASSPYVRQTATQIAPFLKKGAIIVCIAKGIEARSGLTMTEVVQDEVPKVFHKKLVELSGPSLANEFAKGIPTAVVVASKDKTVWPVMRAVFENKTFKIATSTDLRGVSYAGALKNAYAIALGMCDGMGFSMNAKAMMTTLAVDEMVKFVVAAGGKAESVYGLAGLGDLMVTGFGESRNRDFGMKLAGCQDCQKIINSTAKTTEGIDAIAEGYRLAKKMKLKLQILGMLHAIVFKKKQPARAVKEFFTHVKFS